jgi:DNA replication and repair protein RecF
MNNLKKIIPEDYIKLFLEIQQNISIFYIIPFPMNILVNNDNIHFTFKIIDMILFYRNYTAQDNWIKKYKNNLKKDLFLGKTSFGIHRDDIDFILDDFLLKECGSEGQQKNALIAFKLSEIEIVKKIKKYYPILIFDDLSSELDKNKINNILNLIDDKTQTFITTTSIDYFGDNILNTAKLIKVNNSSLEEINNE